VKVKSIIKQLSYSFILYWILILLLFTIGIIFIIKIQFISGLLVWLYIVFVWALFIGNFQQRFRNFLPLIMINLYLIVSFYYNDFEVAAYLLILTPFIGYFLRDKRKLIHTLLVGLSIVYLILEFYFLIEISWYIKMLILILIYIVYLPPFLHKKVKSLKQIFYNIIKRK